MKSAVTARVLIFVAITAVIGTTAVLQSRLVHAPSEQQQKAQYDKSLHEITTNIINGNSTTGFKKIDELYKNNLWFRPRCYEFALEVGASVYAKQKDPSKFSLGPESVVCNYGFYQEYPRALLLDGGSIETAVQFCAATGKNIGQLVPDAEAECFRGIGRALPFIKKDFQNDPVKMATYAIAQCKNISPNPADYNNCLSGLFNKLGREAASVDTANPLKLCDGFEPDIRTRCIGNYKWAVVPLVGITSFAELQKALSDIYPQGISTTTLEAVVWSFGYDTAHLHIGARSPYQSDIQACEDMPGTLASLCIKGYSVGLAKLGIPNRQHVALLQFCTEARAVMPALKQDDCPGSAALEYLEGFYTPQQREAMCREFEEKLGVRCE